MVEGWDAYTSVLAMSQQSPDTGHAVNRTVKAVPAKHQKIWTTAPPADEEFWEVVQRWVDEVRPSAGLRVHGVSAIYVANNVDLSGHIDEPLYVGDKDVAILHMGSAEYALDLYPPGVLQVPRRVTYPPKGFVWLHGAARTTWKHGVTAGPARIVIRVGCSARPATPTSSSSPSSSRPPPSPSSPSTASRTPRRRSSRVAGDKREDPVSTSVVDKYVQHISKNSKYFMVQLGSSKRRQLVADLQRARVLEFDQAGACTNDDRGTVGVRRLVVDDKFCAIVRQIASNHASKFASWAHEEMFDRYMRKIAIQAEGMEPFPRMHGRGETHLEAKDLALRKKNVLHTKEHRDLKMLVEAVYKKVDNLRPAHLKEAPGAEIRYPVTIGVCGTHIMAHSDEPEYDGPGAEIYNFVVAGKGLAVLSSSVPWHNKEEYRVFEVSAGDVWWIADEYRLEWEHQVLRDMPAPVPVDFVDLSEQRIVVTVRAGKASPEQLARWEKAYGSCYEDVKPASTSKSGPTGTRTRSHKDTSQTPTTSKGKPPVTKTGTPGAPATRWTLGALLSFPPWDKKHKHFKRYSTLTNNHSAITLSPGMRLARQSSDFATILAVGTITDKTQTHYVCIVHLDTQNEVQPVLAHWTLEFASSAKKGPLDKAMENKLKLWMGTNEAKPRLQAHPLKSLKRYFSGDADTGAPPSPPLKKPKRGGQGQLVTYSDPGGGTLTSNPGGMGYAFLNNSSSNPGGTNVLGHMGAAFLNLSDGLLGVDASLRRVTGGMTAQEAREREEQRDAAYKAEREAAAQRERDELAKVNTGNTDFLQKLVLQHFTQPVPAPTYMPAPPPPPTPTPTTMPSLKGDLIELKKMHEEGLIDDDEWAALKKDVINRYK